MSSEHQGTDRGVSKRSFEIALVAALDEGRVIGQNGELPWRLPADLQHFKQVTMGHPIVMGRKTFESIGRPLPGRENIVLSRNQEFEVDDTVVVSSVPNAWQWVEKSGAQRVYVIGGESLFRRLLPVADRMYLTVVCDRYGGDTFFPTFDSQEWEVARSRFRQADENNEADLVFVELKAVAPAPREVGADDGGQTLPRILRDLLRSE